MKKLLILSLLLFPMSCPLIAAQTDDTAVAMVEAVRYTADLSSNLTAPASFLVVPYGQAPSQLGGPRQDTKLLCHGCPPAFRPLTDESILVLDALNHAIKRFSKKGLMHSTPLQLSGKPEEQHAMDFAPAPQDGFYVLAPNIGKVFRVDDKGAVINEVEGLFDATAINSDHAKNLLVLRYDGLFRFGSNAVLIERFDPLEGLSLFVDLHNRPYGLRMSESSATLYRVDQASPTTAVDLLTYPLEPATKGKAHFVKAEILGIDAAQNLLLEFIACDDEGIVHLQRMVRVSPDGSINGSLDFKVFPIMAPSLPRERIAMPDGRVLGFQATDVNHQFHTYSIP